MAYLVELEGWLLAHVPGWDTTTVIQLLDNVGQEVPVIHFGDLAAILKHHETSVPDTERRSEAIGAVRGRAGLTLKGTALHGEM